MPFPQNDLAALLFVLFGCSGSSKKQLSTNNRVIEWERSDFQAQNPVNSTDANETYTEEMIYQRLLTIDPNTMTDLSTYACCRNRCR